MCQYNDNTCWKENIDCEQEEHAVKPVKMIMAVTQNTHQQIVSSASGPSNTWLTVQLQDYHCLQLHPHTHPAPSCWQPVAVTVVCE